MRWRYVHSLPSLHLINIVEVHGSRIQHARSCCRVSAVPGRNVSLSTHYPCTQCLTDLDLVSVEEEGEYEEEGPPAEEE